MLNIINCTPHDIHIYNEIGEKIITIQPSGKVIRIGEINKLASLINANGVSIPTYKNSFDLGGVSPPLPIIEGTIYVVSMLSAMALKDREDVYYPGLLLRNESGQIIGCVGLRRYNDE